MQQSQSSNAPNGMQASAGTKAQRPGEPNNAAFSCHESTKRQHLSASRTKPSFFLSFFIPSACAVVLGQMLHNIVSSFLRNGLETGRQSAAEEKLTLEKGTCICYISIPPIVQENTSWRYFGGEEPTSTLFMLTHRFCCLDLEELFPPILLQQMHSFI